MDTILTDLEARLLAGAYRRHETLRKLRPYDHRVLAHCSWPDHLLFKEFKIMPTDGQGWAGLGGSGAERTRICRAFHSLDSKGLLIRVDSKSCKLTRAGLRLAAKLQEAAVGE